jgi:hypothetical protein
MTHPKRRVIYIENLVVHLNVNSCFQRLNLVQINLDK